jgi:hypothetical protein
MSRYYIEVCTQEARRGIGWWKMGIWRIKSVRGNIEQGMCPMCNKKEGLDLDVTKPKFGGRTWLTKDSQVLSLK